MNVALLSMALASQLGSLLVTPVGDRVPVINVEQNCKETTETDKATGIDLPQSFEGCMRDENAARQQIAADWLSYSASVRDSCAQEATLGGASSYVDLLTCMEMSDPARL